MGSFNNWSKSDHLLSREENGFWYAEVPEAKIGDQYKFLIRNNEKEFVRIDPYAREVTSSVGNAIVHDPQFDGWSKDNKGGIYFYNDERSQTPWGDTRPDYGRSQVRQYLRDNAFMWLNEYRVDGLRWDMTAFIRNIHGNDNDPPNDLPDGWSLMQKINQEMKKQQPWKISIAEDMKMNHDITKDVSSEGAGDSVIVAANFTDKNRENCTIGFQREGMWKVRFNSDWNGYDSEFGNFLTTDIRAKKGRQDGLPCKANIGIGSYSIIIFSQDV